MSGTLRNRLSKLYKDEDGATMVEYAIVAAFIAAVCVLSVTAIGTKTQGLFAKAETNFP